MQIFNLHSDNLKNVQDLKIISSEEYDMDGQLVAKKYVQFTVIGNNRQWPDFMTVEDFKKLNPGVIVAGLN